MKRRADRGQITEGEEFRQWACLPSGGTVILGKLRKLGGGGGGVFSYFARGDEFFEGMMTFFSCGAASVW